MVQVRGQSGAFPQATGSTVTWRQDVDLSGLNVMKLGIFYEALQRSALLGCLVLPRCCSPSKWGWVCHNVKLCVDGYALRSSASMHEADT